jgi:hypothetical protein
MNHHHNQMKTNVNKVTSLTLTTLLLAPLPPQTWTAPKPPAPRQSRPAARGSTQNQISYQ